MTNVCAGDLLWLLTESMDKEGHWACLRIGWKQLETTGTKISIFELNQAPLMRDVKLGIVLKLDTAATK